MKRWFHWARAASWVVIGALSFPLGFSDNIAIVWLASVYANVVSDLGAGEAADDSAVLAKLEQLRVAGISRGRRMQPAMPPTMLPTRRRRAASPLTVG